MQDYHAQVHELLKNFTAWEIIHIPRELNSEADMLANRAMNLMSNVK
jgi:ribonuclease HI